MVSKLVHFVAAMKLLRVLLGYKISDFIGTIICIGKTLALRLHNRMRNIILEDVELSCCLFDGFAELFDDIAKTQDFIGRVVISQLTRVKYWAGDTSVCNGLFSTKDHVCIELAEIHEILKEHGWMSNSCRICNKRATENERFQTWICSDHGIIFDVPRWDLMNLTSTTVNLLCNLEAETSPLSRDSHSGDRRRKPGSNALKEGIKPCSFSQNCALCCERDRAMFSSKKPGSITNMKPGDSNDCHQVINHRQQPEKVTMTNLFFLRSMDEGTVVVEDLPRKLVGAASRGAEIDLEGLQDAPMDYKVLRRRESASNVRGVDERAYQETDIQEKKQKESQKQTKPSMEWKGQSQ
ncbi:hypothetical protein Tco_0014256, partial [Tanacetum coccineum]